MKLTVHPLTPERWPDLEALFDARDLGSSRGCLVHVLPPKRVAKPTVQRNRAGAGGAAGIEGAPSTRANRRSHRVSWQGSGRLGLDRPTRRLCEASALAG